MVGLDYSREAIYMAGEMVSGLGIENITFRCVDAEYYDYSDADLVSIPLFVFKKSAIVNRVIETS